MLAESLFIAVKLKILEYCSNTTVFFSYKSNIEQEEELALSALNQ